MFCPKCVLKLQDGDFKCNSCGYLFKNIDNLEDQNYLITLENKGKDYWLRKEYSIYEREFYEENNCISSNSCSHLILVWM